MGITSREPLQQRISSWESRLRIVVVIFGILVSALLFGSFWCELTEFWLILFKIPHVLLGIAAVIAACDKSVGGLLFVVIWAGITLLADVVYTILAVIDLIDCVNSIPCTNQHIPFLVTSIVVFVIAGLDLIIIWFTLTLRSLIAKMRSNCQGQFIYECGWIRAGPALREDIRQLRRRRTRRSSNFDSDDDDFDLQSEYIGSSLFIGWFATDIDEYNVTMEDLFGSKPRFFDYLTTSSPTLEGNIETSLSKQECLPAGNVPSRKTVVYENLV